MPRLTIPRLRQALKLGTIAPVYYVHGSEGILKDEVLALILAQALDPSTRDFNLDVMSAQQTDPGELASACATLPMMASHRVVVLRDVEAWKRKSKAKQPAVQYLERPMPETVLVMVQGNDDDPDEELASRAAAIECAALTGDVLDAWCDDKLAEHEIRLTPEAREHLLRATGGDLGLLTAEVQKLSGLDTSEPLTGEMVGAMVGVRFGETVDDWRDAVLRDDTVRALRLLPQLLDTTGVSGVNMVATLGTALLVVRWARLVAQRNSARGNALATRVKNDLLFKVRPRVGSYDPFSRLVADVAGRWTPPRLKSAIASVLAADVALKNTTISDETGVLTDLVLTLGTSRVKAA